MAIKNKAVIFILSAAVLSGMYLNAARADVGVISVYPEGGSPLAGSQLTNISMDYEKVILTYDNSKQNSNPNAPSGSKTMDVHVSAIFKMMNNGDKAENVVVYFPSNTSSFVQGIPEGINTTNFKVNGVALNAKNLSNVSVPMDREQKTISAYQWQENFYPQKESQIIIEYDSTVYDEDYNIYYLSYVLGTGRGWQGAIKKGDITFVLPERLTSYSVSRKPPQMPENKLPFQVKGNSIKLSFSNYEPDPNEVILLGVYDFDIVDKIEQLKKEQPDFSNTLKIAGLFRELSFDAHCIFCTGATTEEAKKYYSLALDKANSKDELNLALGSFTYGLEGKENNYEIQMNNLFATMSLKCPRGDYECNKESIYFGRGYFDGTPFSAFFDGASGKRYEDYTTHGKIAVPNEDFLKKYAAKMQEYDAPLSVLVNNFLKGIPTNSNYSWQDNIITDNQSAEPTVPPVLTQENNKNPNNNIQQPIRQKNILLMIGVDILFIAMIIFAFFWLLKKGK